MDQYPVLRTVLFILYIFFILHNISFAAEYSQTIEIPSSPNPIGSGARALGMGGAFIAIADDATAASWNPGGLTQLEHPEVSLVGDFFHRFEDNAFGVYPNASDIQTVTQNDINYFSAVYPFSFQRCNMIVSVSYQHLYDFTREWNFPIRLSSDGLSREEDVAYQQEGKLSAIGISYCVQITPDFSLGLTLNIWDDDLTENKWEQRTFQLASGTDEGELFKSGARNIHKYSFSGLNANFGFLWNVDNNFTIGAVLKTPFEADIRHERSYYAYIEFPELPELGNERSAMFNVDETIDMPMSYGIGFAYRFSDNFTGSLDIYRTEWQDFIRRDSSGKEISPITGKTAADSDIDPTHQVRIGGEYRFITSKYLISLAGGIFYDPAPAQGSPDDFLGFSVGSGIKIKQMGRYNFNVAYQYRLGNDVGSSILKEWNFLQDVKEHIVYSSVIIHF